MIWGVFSLLILWAYVLPPPPEEHLDPFGADPFFDVHVLLSNGWAQTDDGLGLSTGQKAIRSYMLPKRSGQRVFLSLDFRKPSNGGNLVHIQQQDPRGPEQGQGTETKWENESFSFEQSEITVLAAGEGFIKIHLLAEAGHGQGVEEILRRFSVTYWPMVEPFNWMALLFYWLLAIAIYSVGAGAVLRSLGLVSRRFKESAAPLHLGARAAVWILAVAMAVSVLFHPEWKNSKSQRFDDMSAVGNAALLLDNKFDVSETFFRPRIRPGLTAILQPWAALLPRQLSSTTMTPSDKKERLFAFYDRANSTYGTHRYVELSVFFAVVAVCLTVIAGSIAMRFGAGPGIALGTCLFSGFFLHNCLYNAISESATLAVTVAAGLAFALAWRRQTLLSMAGAGLALSCALATKETSIVLASAIAGFQVWALVLKTKKARGTLIGRCAIFWAMSAVFPLWYYGLVLDTGFAEITANHSLLEYHQQFHGTKDYPPLTFLNGLQTCWTAFGVGLVLIALGIAGAARDRFRSDADRFFVCWLVGSLWTWTLPYVFVRFLIFTIPPAAYFSARGVGFLLDLFPGAKKLLLKEMNES